MTQHNHAKPESPGLSRVWIRASPEILKELSEGWSRPVEVHATENPDGSWEMTLRACYNEKGEQIARVQPSQD